MILCRFVLEVYFSVVSGVDFFWKGYTAMNDKLSVSFCLFNSNLKCKYVKIYFWVIKHILGQNYNTTKINKTSSIFTGNVKHLKTAKKKYSLNKEVKFMTSPSPKYNHCLPCIVVLLWRQNDVVSMVTKRPFVHSFYEIILNFFHRRKWNITATFAERISIVSESTSTGVVHLYGIIRLIWYQTIPFSKKKTIIVLNWVWKCYDHDKRPFQT